MVFIKVSSKLNASVFSSIEAKLLSGKITKSLELIE